MSLAFIAAYAWSVIDPALNPTLEGFLRAVTWAVWGTFIVDFAIRIALARNRFRYLREHWYDFLFVVLPMFRVLRVLHILGTLRILGRVLHDRVIGRTGMYVVVSAVLCNFFAALAVLDAEREAPGALITNFGDALWWAAVTSATVGYGDVYPVTVLGRIIAVGLMIVGIALLGGVTAGIAAWLVDAVQRDRRRRAPETGAAPDEDARRHTG
nr:potassium channel family protein [Brevibacterium daeguense]